MRTYDLCREEGYGALLSIDFHGDMPFEEIDGVLAAMETEPEEFGGDPEYPFQRGFDIERAIRSSEPSEDGDYDEWHYRPLGDTMSWTTQPGEVIVTRLVVNNVWRRRCYAHLHQVAVCGLPAEQFLPPEADDVDGPPIRDGYLYVCRDCQQRIDARRKTQRDLWMAESARRRQAGVPEHLVYA